ncbi:ABC transporter permease [Methanocella conradii]|uniref:ABC transporter permease n=1 Tax=Methanocella conradii TaxID=1175444 RepID=UPI001ED90B77|nr:ABC transporter permease subunit [Methanocella conradii]MDI6897455.1 ABC transporter permease subunit [Methanocella conradii]
MLKVARKEFAEITGNPAFLVAVAVYILLIILMVKIDVDGFQGETSIQVIQGMLIHRMSSIYSTWFCIVPVFIGFSCMASEYGGTLNTLLTKPVYRDTIINGKLIACLGGILCLNVLAFLFMASLMIILFGGIVVQALLSMFGTIVVLFFFSLLYSSIFLLFSMLIGILIKERSAAFLVCMLMLILIVLIIPTAPFVGSLSKIFGMVNPAFEAPANRLLTEMMPKIIISNIYMTSMPQLGWSDYFSVYAKVLLFIYPLVLLILCYISFLRRDIA